MKESNEMTQDESLKEAVEYLREILGEIYYIDDFSGKLGRYEIKALVGSVDGLKVEIRPREHPPPHFHVKSAEINASFAIEDCELLKGNVSGKVQKKIKHWHSKYKQTLVDRWNEMRPTDCAVGDYTGH